MHAMPPPVARPVTEIVVVAIGAASYAQDTRWTVGWRRGAWGT
jgi:hypothetical protein